MRLPKFLARSARLHEAAKRHPLIARAIGEKPRSPEWPAVEHAHLKLEPTCRACAGSDKLNVHHEQPFHLHPELELQQSNLITLCMGERKCHLLIGHGDNFQLYNPNVVADAAEALAHPVRFAAIAARAKAARLSA